MQEGESVEQLVLILQSLVHARTTSKQQSKARSLNYWTRSTLRARPTRVQTISSMILQGGA
jgi:hypothetical protein